MDELMMDKMKVELGQKDFLTVKCDVTESSQVKEAVD
jgi:hypothetical protein